MGDNEEHIEETELVDISEVSDALPAPAEDKAAGESEEPRLERRGSIAILRERFAAFFVDCIIFFYSYFIIGYICRRAFYGSWDGPIPSYGWQGLATNSIFVLFIFMYYFVLEGVFFATFGKFCCWMYVRKKDGSLASMSQIFVRTVMRAIDFTLPFIPFFLMDLTRRHQRLGDLLAGTTVIKKRPAEHSHYNITMDNVASASGRAVSALIDIMILGPLVLGCALLLTPDSPWFSRSLLLFLPMVPFIYYAVTEAAAGTSPGKWVMGYMIAHEEGFGVSASGAIVRTILRPVDMGLFGLLSIWISPKKQRFGDLAADTIATKQRREWPGLIALCMWAAISAAVLWAGLQNGKNFLSKEFSFNFLPAIEIMGEAAEEQAYKSLTLTHIRFAAEEPSKIRTPAIFKPGETVFIVSDVYGYERSGRMVWIQEDLDVKYPDGSIGLHQENIVDYHQVLSFRGPIELSNSIKIPDNAQGGLYTVTLTVRDLFAHEKTSEKQAFEVKVEAPAVPAIPEPSAATPPAPEAPATTSPAGQ